MNEIAQEAARELLLFNLGVRTTQELIEWADHWIEKEPSPSFSLIEISTARPDRIEDFITFLSRLKEGAFFWDAFRSAMPYLYDFIVSNPDEAERISSSLFMLVVSDLNSMPDDFHFIYHFEDAFYLARDGSYGTLDEVYTDFVAELARFKSGAEPGAVGNEGHPGAD